MRIVRLDGCDWVIELDWSRGEHKRTLIEEALLANANAGVLLKAGRKAYVLGTTPSKSVIGKPSLAALFATRTREQNAIYVLPLEDGGYWVAVIAQGQVLPGSDLVVTTLDEARKWVEAKLAVAGFTLYGPSGLHPEAQDLDWHQWLRLDDKTRKPLLLKSLVERRGPNYVLVGLFVVALAGAGTVLYLQQNEGPAQMSEADTRLVLQRLDRMANEKLLHKLEKPAGSAIYQSGMALLHRIGYARYGWNLKTATLTAGGLSSLWDRSLVGNLEEIQRGLSQTLGEEISVAAEKDMNQATVSVSHAVNSGRVDLKAAKASLVGDNQARVHLVSLVQKVPEAKVQVTGATPFITPQQVPKKVSYKNPYVAKQVTVTGSHRYRLEQIVDALDQVPYFRVNAIDMQFSDNGQISQWVIRGELYEKT